MSDVKVLLSERVLIIDDDSNLFLVCSDFSVSMKGKLFDGLNGNHSTVPQLKVKRIPAESICIDVFLLLFMYT